MWRNCKIFSGLSGLGCNRKLFFCRLRNCRKISDATCAGYFFEVKLLKQLSKNVGVGGKGIKGNALRRSFMTISYAFAYEIYNRRNRQVKMYHLCFCYRIASFLRLVLSQISSIVFSSLFGQHCTWLKIL